MTDFNRENLEETPVQFYDSSGRKIEGAIYNPSKPGSLEKAYELVQRAIIDDRLSPARIMQTIEYFRNQGIEPSLEDLEIYSKIENILLNGLEDPNVPQDAAKRFQRDIEAGEPL